MAITPGIILIPSNMIILKEKVAGYNNVLTLATKNMKFGVNKNVNYVQPQPTKVKKQEVTKVKQKEVTKVKQEKEEVQTTGTVFSQAANVLLWDFDEESKPPI